MTITRVTSRIHRFTSVIRLSGHSLQSIQGSRMASRSILYRCVPIIALRSHILHTCPRNLARAPQKVRTDHGVSDLVCFTQLSLSEMMHGEVSGLVCFTQLPLSKRVLDPGVGSFEATSSRGDWRKEMESAASATAIADAEDIESQRYRPCCERPDDSMSCRRCVPRVDHTHLAALHVPCVAIPPGWPHPSSASPPLRPKTIEL